MGLEDWIFGRMLRRPYRRQWSRREEIASDVGLCVRCGWPEHWHDFAGPPSQHPAGNRAPRPCHRYEEPSPVWVRAFSTALGKVIGSPRHGGGRP